MYLSVTLLCLGTSSAYFLCSMLGTPQHVCFCSVAVHALQSFIGAVASPSTRVR